MAENKLLGYKLIKPEYAQAVLNIEGHLTIGTAIKIDQLLCKPEAIAKIKAAGVLDLWFEPVYESDILKEGDYIVFLKSFDGKPEGSIRKITSFYGDHYNGRSSDKKPSKGWVKYNDGSFRWQGNGYYLDEDFRLATKEEIESFYNLPEINGYQGKLKEDLLIYGCAEIPVEWFHDNEGTRSIKSLVLSSNVEINEFQVEQIKRYLNSIYLKSQ